MDIIALRAAASGLVRGDDVDRRIAALLHHAARLRQHHYHMI